MFFDDEEFAEEVDAQPGDERILLGLIARRTASATARRAPCSSEKRTSCFAGCTFTFTCRGSTVTEGAAGG